MSRLEISPAEFRLLLDRVATNLTEFLETLPDQPAWSAEQAESVARSVIEPVPETGHELDAVLRRLFEDLIPACYNTASPGYLAYIPGGGLPESAVADLIADVTNRFASVWIAAPAMAQIEWVVVRWFCQIVGFPEGAGGFLTTGGSLANWSALVTARRTRLGDDFQRATIYTSGQAHHCIRKAAVMAGFPAANLREVAVDSRFRVQVGDLEEQIRQDRANGWTPFAIVAHAGTTNTGAVDDLQSVADLANSENLWLHVDAAYGGFFAMTERGRRRLAGLERADSITLDPHKGLFLPYGTGSLVVRDASHLEEAHRVDGDYMPPMQSSEEFVDFCNLSPELSRQWRGLRIWLPLQLHGAAAFRDALDEKLDLTEWATEQLRQVVCGPDEELVIVGEPELSIVAFRLHRPALTQDQNNALNRQLLDCINRPRRVYLTPTTLDGDFVIRICVLSFRTHQQQMSDCLALIEAAIKEVSEFAA